MGRELTDRAVVEAFMSEFGGKYTATLLGVATVAAILGADDHESFMAMPFGSEPSRYRWLADFRKLGARLRAEGYDLGDAPETVRVAILAAAPA